MHDFLLAKEILSEVSKIVEENNFRNVSEVFLEIGTIEMAHDGLDAHTEDISIENLKFGLESISKNTPLEKAKFNIKKVDGNDWKIKKIK